MHALSQAGALLSVPGFCFGIAACREVPAGAVSSLWPWGTEMSLGHLHPAYQAGSALWVGHRPQTPSQKPTVPAIPEEMC